MLQKWYPYYPWGYVSKVSMKYGIFVDVLNYRNFGIHVKAWTTTLDTALSLGAVRLTAYSIHITIYLLSSSNYRIYTYIQPYIFYNTETYTKQGS